MRKRKRKRNESILCQQKKRKARGLGFRSLLEKTVDLGVSWGCFLLYANQIQYLVKIRFFGLTFPFLLRREEAGVGGSLRGVLVEDEGFLGVVGGPDLVRV